MSAAPDVLPTGDEASEVERRLALVRDGSASPAECLQATIWLVKRGIPLPDPPPAEPEPGPSTSSQANSPPAASEGPPPPPPGDLPAHSAVEFGVLGRMVVSPETIAAAREALDQNDFSSAERMRLFAKLCDLQERGEPIDHHVIEAEFHASGMSSLASRDLVAEAMRQAGPADAMPRYFGILKDYAMRRAMALAARALAEGASGRATKETFANARATLDRLDEQGGRDEVPASLKLKKWPDPPAPAAYHGLAGEFVRLVAPRTEADPVAILGQFLVCFGNAIGRTAHWTVDASRHYCNEFLCVVGLTSRGRKGTSWDITEYLFELVDEGWVRDCHHSGVASGEGLIRTVRDAVSSQLKVGSEMHSVLEDAGVDDKRALWVEDEFQGVLAVMKREGSTLSSNLRKAWQSGDLENANKQSPMKATNAHVSLIGHITFDELARSLGQGEIGNGFANRFMWLCSRRSSLLPRGGDLLGEEFKGLVEPLRARLDDTIDYIKGEKLLLDIQVGMTDEAWAIWDSRYLDLTRTRLGNVGLVTDRAEAHVRRLAVIYAMLDGPANVQAKVGVEHLNAALAFWDYCERSAVFIFGDEDVDPVAEKLLAALVETGDEGLTQNVIVRKVFSGRKTDEVNKALSTLVRMCLVRQIDRPGKGRPAKVWVACR